MPRWLRPPGGDVTLWAVIFLAGSLYIAVRTWTGQFNIGSVSALLLALAGLGLWFRSRWGRWLAYLWLVHHLFIMLAFRGGLGWRFALHVAIAALAVWYLRQLDLGRRRDSEGEASDDDGEKEPILSIAAFLRELPYTDRQVLARAASKAWNAELSTDEDGDATSFVLGEGTPYFVKHEDEAYLVHWMDRPYIEDRETAAAQIPELRLQQAIGEHNAWIAVDGLFPKPETEEDRRATYAKIGRLIAELVDEDCLALFFPETEAIRAFHPFHLDLLRGGHALQVLDQTDYVPVVGVGADDPRMQEAVATARTRWPEFVAAFENRGEDGGTFSVKAPVTDGDATEFIWLEVTALEGDRIHGNLGNEPVSLPRLRLHDPVRVAVADLNDWIFIDPQTDEMHGGFTIQVLTEAYKEAQDRAATESPAYPPRDENAETP